MEVRERKTWDMGTALLSFAICLLVIILEIIFFVLVPFNQIQAILFALIGLLIYALAVFSLFGRVRIREIRRSPRFEQRKEAVEHPSYSMEELEKSLASLEPIKPIMPSKHAHEEEFVQDVQKEKYIGSTQTRTYHLRNCRLAKLIKQKFKLSNNSLEFFRKRKFRACKVCMGKKKKKA